MDTSNINTTNSVPVLSWPLSLFVMMLGCTVVGWLCATGGNSKEGPGASILLLALLIGTIPFFVRRLGGYTLPSLLIIIGSGSLVSLGSFIFHVNIIVLPCLLMGALLSIMFTKNEYGILKEQQIDLEKQQPDASKFLASSTEQEQNILWLGDFAVVIIVCIVLAWLYTMAKSLFNF